VIAGTAVQGGGQGVSVHYRVSGRWTFGSGRHEAAWMLGSFQILDDGQPRRRDDGAMFWRGLPHGCASRPRASWSVRVSRPIRPLPVWDCVVSSGQLTTVANSGPVIRPTLLG
jgi:hypothetical protein